MQLHILFYITGIELQPYATDVAKDPQSFQYCTAAFSRLSVKPPETNYLNYMFVNTAFKSLHNASSLQTENCYCWWSFPTTTDACSSLICQCPTFIPSKIHAPEVGSWSPALLSLETSPCSGMGIKGPG